MSDNIKMTGKDLATVFIKAGFYDPKNTFRGLAKTKRTLYNNYKPVSQESRRRIVAELSKAKAEEKIKMTPFELRLLKKEILNPKSAAAPKNSPIINRAEARREKIAHHQIFVDELKQKRAAKEAAKIKEKIIKDEIKRDYLDEYDQGKNDKKAGDILHDLAEKGKEKALAERAPKPARPALREGRDKPAQEQVEDLPIG